MAAAAGGASSGALLPTTAELKTLTPFLQRAHELRTADPPMAYWCSLYAAQLGIGVKSKDRDSTLFLGKLMDNLEAQKKALAGSDVVLDETASAAYVENFALKVFTAADNQDRAGQATRATARNFLVASQFLEVLNAFGPLEPEIADKIKYAKWKAADIAKAFKEGRVPHAGPPGGEPSEAIAVTTPGETVAESDAPTLISGSTTHPVASAPPLERTTSASSSSLTHGDNANRLRARLSIHAASAQSPNFSMPLPAPPPQIPSGGPTASAAAASTSALEAEVAAQQAELVRLGLAPPDWQGAGASAPSSVPALGPGSTLSSSPSQIMGRPLPVPPPGVPAREGLPNIPSGFPFVGGVASGPGSTASVSNQASPLLNGSSFLGSGGTQHHLPQPPSGFLNGGSTRDSASVTTEDPRASSPSPYPYHQQHQVHQPAPLPPPSQPSTTSPQPYGVPPAAAPTFHATSTLPTAPPLPTIAAAPPAPPPPPTPAHLPDSLTPSQTAKAQKLAKWAVSSLDYDDVGTAARHLREALDIVEGRQRVV